MKHKEFETERLILRPTSIDDAGFILQLFNSPKWLKYIGDRNIRSEKDASDYIRDHMLSQLERLGYSNFTVIRKSDRTKLGICGLYDRDGVEGIDIGFAFLPQFEGRGYAMEAAGTVLKLAFSEFGLSKIRAITGKLNFASQKVLTKLGMQADGTLRLPGDDEELLVYSISRPE